MATNTKNYNLVKPAGNELADISVINKNMDTIDEQLIPVNNLTSEDSKRALAAVQGKVLNEKVGDLSALNTVHKKNLVQAINEAAEGSGITVVTQNEYEAMQEAGSIDPDKLYGIVDAYDFSAGNVEISDDLATKLDLATSKTVENAIDTVNSKISQNKDSVVKNTKDISALKESLSEVKQSDAKKLPLTGGTLTGGVTMNGDWACLGMKSPSNGSDRGAILRYYVDPNSVNQTIELINDNSWGVYGNASYLILSSIASELSTQLRLRVVKNNGSSYGDYKIYGEHNITVSQSAPSSALAEGCQHQVY